MKKVVQWIFQSQKKRSEASSSQASEAATPLINSAVEHLSKKAELNCSEVLNSVDESRALSTQDWFQTINEVNNDKQENRQQDALEGYPKTKSNLCVTKSLFENPCKNRADVHTSSRVKEDGNDDYIADTNSHKYNPQDKKLMPLNCEEDYRVKKAFFKDEIAPNHLQGTQRPSGYSETNTSTPMARRLQEREARIIRKYRDFRKNAGEVKKDDVESNEQISQGVKKGVQSPVAKRLMEREARIVQKYKTYRKVTTPVTNSKGLNRPSLLKKAMHHSNHNEEKKELTNSDAEMSLNHSAINDKLSSMMKARRARGLTNSLQISAHHNKEELEPIKITPNCTPNLQSSYPIRGKTSDTVRTINQDPRITNLSLKERTRQSVRNSSFGRNNIGLQKPNYSIAPTGSPKTSLRNGYMHESMSQKKLGLLPSPTRRRLDTTRNQRLSGNLGSTHFKKSTEGCDSGNSDSTQSTTRFGSDTFNSSLQVE
mmetsp:Transcript_32623/g.48627  ORF Transcript_32623/g.48627 Transcript_32623/m.48627 type:complete len:484 (-) Transcript_32623:26-1477(-)